MADISLAFFWHQHQPYYPDDVAGENPMPWVRLHGVKDYYGMAMHLREVPEMRCTINLVPSLLKQILDYTDHGATDQFLTASRKSADGVQEDDALFLLDHFFMANPDTMILPFPRYAELYHRRGLGRNTAKEALRRFTERDLRDLQVWFNLAWIHPIAFEHDHELRELLEKGRYFTEDEKLRLLDKQLDLMRQIIPLHKELADRGQVELTTTPYFHPILPLLFDKKLAREAMPEVKLPRYTGGYLEDAALHVRRAIEQHVQIFGTAPQGMWPAEGSVCQPMLPLLAQHGIRWIATDEEILTGSTKGAISRDARGHVRNPEKMYCPYNVAEAGRGLSIVFRDHALSDMIGFQYQRSEPVAAAEDLLTRVRGIGQAIPEKKTALVSIILDGENCWEHYPGGGVAFLRALYQKCAQAKDIRPVKIGQYLQENPPSDTLPHLFAGSWINHNYAIWIGHEEDNTAWDALHRTREYLHGKSASFSRDAESSERSVLGEEPDEKALRSEDSASRLTKSVKPLSAIERAWEEIYIAEGSDWFWWYGDDHSSAQDALFDYLFRKHLQNVYLLLGDPPPPELARPISRRSQRAIYSLPRTFLDVRIDGRQTYFEWATAGRYTCQNERGTMAMVTRGPLKELYFGFNVQKLLVRIDCETAALSAMADYEALRLSFVEPAGWEILVDRPGRPEQQVRLLRLGQPMESQDIEIGIDQIAELSVPFERLGIKADQPMQFFVDLLEGGQSRDRAPREGTISLVCPSPNFELIMWDV